MGRASSYTALSNVLLFPFTITLFILTVDWGGIMAAILVGVAIIAINVRFAIANLRLGRVPNAFSAWKVFKLSSQYLFIILVLVVLGHVF